MPTSLRLWPLLAFLVHDFIVQSGLRVGFTCVVLYVSKERQLPVEVVTAHLFDNL